MNIEHRTPNIERRMGKDEETAYDLEQDLLWYSV
jgi:hypothetical protein